MRSGFEKEISKLLKRKKVDFRYEPQGFKYTVQRTYTPDFLIECDDFWIEAKGLFTSADRTKMLAVKSQHPDLDIRLWFQRDNWLTKKKKQTYSQWAEKHGFPWHVGTDFPKKWF